MVKPAEHEKVLITLHYDGQLRRTFHTQKSIRHIDGYESIFVFGKLRRLQRDTRSKPVLRLYF